MALTGVLLDTNAYAAFKRGKTEAAELLEAAETIFLPVIVLGELLSGFARGNRQERNLEELHIFLGELSVQILMVDEQTCHHYAAAYASLRARGRPVPTNDLWIAAIALRHELPLYSYDAHFHEVIRLRVVTSAAELRS